VHHRKRERGDKGDLDDHQKASACRRIHVCLPFVQAGSAAACVESTFAG
jgi:hypothetical protein